MPKPKKKKQKLKQKQKQKHTQKQRSKNGEESERKTIKSHTFPLYGTEIVGPSPSAELDHSKGGTLSSKHPGGRKGDHKVSSCFLEPVNQKHNIFSATNFFSATECERWISWSNKYGWQTCDQKATSEYAERKQNRLSFKDKVLASVLFERMFPLLQYCRLDVLDGKKAVTCHPNIRVYRYNRDDSFGRHVDGSNDLEEGQTKLTVLVYLCGGLQGGETVFYKHHFGQAVQCSITPQTGLLLLHEHGNRCLTHEAKKIEAGVKYVLRTDVVYEY